MNYNNKLLVIVPSIHTPDVNKHIEYIINVAKNDYNYQILEYPENGNTVYEQRKLIRKTITKINLYNEKQCIITCSDVIIRELNYLINLNKVKLDAKFLIDANIDSIACLDYKDVSVYIIYNEKNIFDCDVQDGGFDADNMNIEIRKQHSDYIKVLNYIDEH